MKGWTLSYTDFDPDREKLREALCTLGNGYFATRGAAPEAGADGTHYPGTYIAGGYDRAVTLMRGREIENEDLVNFPNWLPFTFRIGDAAGHWGPWLDLRRVEVNTYHQELHFQRGVLTRTFRFTDDAGRRTYVRQERLVSMADAHMAALRTTIRAENWSGVLELSCALDGRVTNAGVPRYAALNGVHLRALGTEAPDDATLFLRSATRQSGLQVALAARTRLWHCDAPVYPQRSIAVEPAWIAQRCTLAMAPGEAVTAEKVVALYTSRDRGISECGLEAREAVGRAGDFEVLAAAHARAWAHLWERFELGLEGADRRAALRTLRIVRLHVFHLLQTVSLNTIDYDVGVPARGLHGEAYRGHIFWDELFIFPLLNLRQPEITRALLRYRYRRLDAARRAAHDAGLAGAMYPWQSGSNGREESQLIHLNPRSGRWVPDNSRLQRHVSAAIAYNVWQYYQVTHDVDFVVTFGAEMLLEIARFWAGQSHWNERHERYEILGVMGPDEYHDAYPHAERPGLDNNAYTNVMAVWVLCRALDVLNLVTTQRRAELMETIALSEAELERWAHITRRMRVCFHDDGIISQFEGYERLQEFDWEGYRRRYGDIQRLDRILESEGDSVNHYKASKQADVLMLLYLFSHAELAGLFERLGYPLDEAMLARNVDYYLARTSHGSTLSRVVHSAVLARRDAARAWQLFTEALESDVADVQGGTTPEGIHLGAMAGTVDFLQRVCLGLETRGDVLHLDPCLPPNLTAMRLRVRYRGYHLRLELRRDRILLTCDHARLAPIRVAVAGEERVLGGGESCRFDLTPGRPMEPLQRARA